MDNEACGNLGNTDGKLIMFLEVNLLIDLKYSKVCGAKKGLIKHLELDFTGKSTNKNTCNESGF